MTCIVALKHNGVVYIGGDSLGSNGHLKVVRNDMKVFKPNKHTVSGFTTSYRMGQLLMYNPTLFEDINDMKDMVTEFIPRIQELFDDNGYSKTYGNGEKEGGVFLVGIKDELYKVDSDFQIAMTSHNFDACGCGEEFALGSLFTTEDSDLTPEDRILSALVSAETFSTGVQRPFYIINTKDGAINEYE